MRHTLYWVLMNEEFGEARAASLHTDLALSTLDSRTAEQAFEAGFDPRDIWIAVCDAMSVPESRRLGREKPRSRPF